jgi:hypothetical protein
MPSRLTDVIVDCHDLELLSAFWRAALGYEERARGESWLAIASPEVKPTADALRAAAPAPMMAFVLVPEPRSGKNRVHVDITPVDATQEEEVERLIGLGASRADIGQGDTPWVVMADPEGNEFCVMRPLEEPSAPE